MRPRMGHERKRNLQRHCPNCRFPKVQSKVRKEVLHKLGAYNPVNLVEDKERLPYCDAFLMEVQRFMTQAGFGAPHQVTNDRPAG